MIKMCTLMKKKKLQINISLKKLKRTFLLGVILCWLLLTKNKFKLFSKSNIIFKILKKYKKKFLTYYSNKNDID